MLGRQFTWNVKPYFPQKNDNEKHVSKYRLLQLYLAFQRLKDQWNCRTEQDSSPRVVWHLTFITLWAKSAENKLMIVFLFFPENRIWHYMQIVYSGEK